MEEVVNPLKRQPKQKRSQVVVDSVLEAATRILSKLPLKETTTNKIASFAGVSIGSLYDYFPNKESIAVALMDKRMDQIIRDLGNILNNSDSNLENLIEESVLFVTKDYLDRRKFLREIFVLAPEAGRMEALYRCRDAVQQILEKRLVEKDQKTAEWAKRKAFVLVNSTMGFLEGYIIIDTVEIEVPLVQMELRTLMRAILEVKDQTLTAES